LIAAVFRKSVRDVALVLGLVLLAATLFEALFVFAISELAGELAGFLARVEVVRRLISALLGADLLADLTPTALVTIGMAHPLLYALTWTLLLTLCTRVPAGEIDRGTADLLLALPVSRAGVYMSLSGVALICAAAMSVVPLLGIALGERIQPLDQPIVFDNMWKVAANLFALNLCVASGTLLTSSIASRRGVAIAVPLAVLLASFLVNFLAQFWSPAKSLSFLGLLDYYKPLPIVRTGEWPVWSLSVLLGLSATSWSAGLVWFHRRDIPAV
jgi:ABC-2 type transport system permease protein